MLGITRWHVFKIPAAILCVAVYSRTGIGLSHVACGNCHAMTTDTIFVDIDTKTRSVDAIYKTFGRPKRLGHNVVRDSGVGEG
jgi:hypothetical protein